MKVLDLFSGLAGFSMAGHRAGMETVAFCEVDKVCHDVLRRHYPGVPIFDDVRTLNGEALRSEGISDVDVVTFGWPCQDLSVAGKRKGLAGERSGLLFEALRIIAELRPRWFVAENVPGLLSSEGGRDMGTAVVAMEELGYCVSWTTLDAQYFGVPQRRRRVFFVGSLGTTSSIQVLFKPESMCGNIAESKAERQEVAATISQRSQGRGYGDEELNGNLVAVFGGANPNAINVSTTLNAHGGCGRYDFESESLIVNRAIVASSSGNGYWREGIGPLRARGQDSHENLVAFHARQDPISDEHVSLPLEAKGGQSICFGLMVRRLLPVEFERLQGYQDNYTAWGIDETGKRKIISDTHRYRMLGNSVAVPVVEWIMKRIKQVDEERSE